jgi:hypothetical protein
MRPVILPFTALAVALGLAACHQAAAPDDNSADAAAIANDAGASADNATNTAADTASDQGTPPDIAIPAVAADAPAEQATPLVEAAQAAATIVADTSVTRVTWNDGWAWERDGQIIRTASHDGGRVSYFHPGDDHPYLVQDGGRSYGYDDGGKLAHVYDHGGHPQAPNATDQHAASQFDRQARQDHDHARAAPAAKPAPPHNDPDKSASPQGKPGDHPDHDPSPQPRPTPNAKPDDHGHGNQANKDRGQPDDRNGPGH